MYSQGYFGVNQKININPPEGLAGRHLHPAFGMMAHDYNSTLYFDFGHKGKAMRLRWILLLLLVSLAVFPRLGFSQSESVESLAAKAREAATKRDYFSAARIYEKLLQWAPDLVEARSNLGMMHYLSGAYAKAVQVFDQALKEVPKLYAARLFLGICLLEMDRTQEAIPHLEQSIQDQPGDRLARLQLARALHLGDRGKEALTQLEHLREHHPDDAEVLYQLGRVHMRLALDAYEELKSRNPQHHRVFQLLGETYEMQGLYGPAIANYTKALEDNPEARGLHVKIGDLHQATGDLEKARAAYRREVLGHPGNAIGLYKLGAVLLDEGENKEACSLLKRAVAAAESFGPARVALGRCLLLENQNEAALEHLLKAIELAPEEPSGYYQLAQVYRRLGKIAEAQQALQTYQKLESLP